MDLMSREKQKFKSRGDLKWWKTQKLRKRVQKVAGKNPRLFLPTTFSTIKVYPFPLLSPVNQF